MSEQPSAVAALVEGVLALVRQQVLAEVQQKTPKAATMKRLLTPKEAGQYLGRSEGAVRQLIHKRKLPVVKFGRNIRIDIRDLEKIVDEYRV
jgi:excisionase family DNA binding protein